ncbi:MAG TPA: DUF362 domain-containing protein [Thermodesulfovibrionales bacterium]|nr:DUF362 domain-containing protein [Thermodesulfovibrionales bacterium]
MARVIFRNASYDYELLKPLFFEIMERIGGDEIRRKNRVLIKPNLLAPARPERALLTHPSVVRAAVDYVLIKGARPFIADSPAIGSFEKVIKEGGIREALKGLDVEMREFAGSKTVDIGEPFHRVEIAKEALDADAIINLPKLKTHSQMLLTLGVKNLFGCIVGLRKPEWHLRTGVDRDMFARLLVQLCRRLAPSYTVLDGILAMEGQGPGKGGTPRELGILIGSDNAFVLDGTVCRMFGLERAELVTNRIAGEMGLTDDHVEVDGPVPEIRDFRFPGITPLVFGPKPLHGVMRRYLVQRPVADEDLCRLCGECGKYCPAGAISRDKKQLHFDYEKCIRCYCCIEVCPYAALRSEETLPGKMIRRLTKRNK